MRLVRFSLLPHGTLRYGPVEEHAETTIETRDATRLNRLLHAIDHAIELSLLASPARSFIELQLCLDEFSRKGDTDFDRTGNPA